MTALATLKRRSEFLRAAASGKKWATAGLILQAVSHRPAQRNDAPPPTAAEHDSVMRVGYTASRKVGDAVLRNRAKRRLRAAAREVLRAEAVHGHDYVLIARTETVSRDFAMLKDDLRQALRRLRLARGVGGSEIRR